MRLTKCCYSSTRTSPFTFLLRLYLYKTEMDEAFIVIILSCSSSRESMYLSWPASFLLMMLFDDMSESLSVVFPWSTCAKMQMLRQRSL